MPIRRLNYTARQRIRRSDVTIALYQVSSGTTAFDAILRLGEYRFDEDARVIVEAYRQTSLMRFDLGTVSVPVQPADRTLSAFESEDEVLFRVRVTATSGRPGLLLGEVDQVRPVAPGEQPDRRIPLLKPVPGEIGEEVWRVEFDGPPLLRVSSELPDWKQTVRSDAFRALVFPEAFRQVLQQILFREDYRRADDLADWRSQWLMFASRVPGVGRVPSSRDECDDWIEESVAAFARQYRMRTRYSAERRESA